MIGTLIITGINVAVVAWAFFANRDASRRLAALRRNCFVTNERGHRVRYAEASDAVRAKVETE